ncbi:ApaG protein [Umboniibacter marinipuniceus]|uniref:ApaG protein n=2 Tax=Umboniibacter marinipuniceus TaxID=569599 RepID=A0A3M0AMD5_9GAMM|nr:ApaG protein [Umboniibacter marinipuniceus]
MMISEQVTVRVRTEYVGVEERGRTFHHAFAYHIEITNISNRTIQLLTREWTIIDADGHEDRVEGEGVVGELPILGENELFSYTSWAMIGTNAGTMHGFYGFIDVDSQEHFRVEIPCFRLSRPGVLH